jgi:hypothetical protein
MLQNAGGLDFAHTYNMRFSSVIGLLQHLKKGHM